MTQSAHDESAPHIVNAWTLKEAKAWLRRNWEAGAACPCCRQFVKLYKRKLTSTMASALVLFTRSTDPIFHGPSYLARFTSGATIRGGDWSKLRYWGLIGEARRRDGSNRSGYWFVTDLGFEFARGNATVASHVYLYNGERWPREGGTTQITIRQALGDHFDYAELMAATPDGSNPPTKGLTR